MRKLVPDELELDTFEGEAWIGLVPFRMSGVRPRCCPAVPWLSEFLEFNVRTYVRARGAVEARPGVYFFSLEASNPVAVSLARSLFHLPYFRADMTLERSGADIDYRTVRRHRDAPEAEFAGTYGPVGEIDRARPGSLEHWLTERYCLYTVHRGRVLRGEIHHQPWPLQPAGLEIKKSSMAEANGIALPDVAPVLHFARRIGVVVWPLVSVEGKTEEV